MRLARPTLALLAAAVARAHGPGEEHLPSEVIFPEQRLPLSFSHELHLAQNLPCTRCHAEAPRSRVARDFLIPPEAACAGCHKIERDKPDKQAKPGAACRGCHPGFAGAGQPRRVDIPVPSLKFNHEVHVARGMECTACHAGVREALLATREHLPHMPLCLGCHDGRQAPAQCTTCHLGDPEGRLRTSLPGGTLVPSGVLRGDAHDLAFGRGHGRVAANDARYCESCHRPDWCLGCHNGVVKPLDLHGNDYLTVHAAEARRNVPDCGSCHRRQSFCLGCHQRSGVVPARDVLGVDPAADPSTNGYFTAGRRFHPDGWADDARGPSHHAVQAQRNVAACASCHREETCLACHSTRAVRGEPSPVGRFVSPHPARFADSARCRALADRNPRVCLKCHALGDAARQCR